MYILYNYCIYLSPKNYHINLLCIIKISVQMKLKFHTMQRYKMQEQMQNMSWMNLRGTQCEKKSQCKNGGATNKTYQEFVAASECSRQHTRIWLDRSLDCILHSTNIETPCAQLNPRQRGRWNIEFVELNRRTVKKKLRSRNHFTTKKDRIKRKWMWRRNIDTMQSVSIISVFLCTVPIMLHISRTIRERQFFASIHHIHILYLFCTSVGVFL